MDAIINTLTGNADINKDLVGQVLGMIAKLNREKAALGIETVTNQDLIKELQKQIETLEKELDAYRERLATANGTLESTITKMRDEIARPALPALPPSADGKRRSRKRNSRKRKSRRSRKSKKRHY
jgi:hypothetical protein